MKGIARHADLSSADLRSANLRNADLSNADLSHADLRSANLSHANLSHANLSHADLSSADLSSANLRCANLRYADLSSANLRYEVPVIQNIDAAILAACKREGCALDMRDWHACDTTHCRAGWAVTLAGEAGRALEAKTSPYLAGRLIYEASRPGVPAPDFFADNETAMRDIEDCAAKAPLTV